MIGEKLTSMDQLKHEKQKVGGGVCVAVQTVGCSKADAPFFTAVM